MECTVGINRTYNIRVPPVVHLHGICVDDFALELLGYVDTQLGLAHAGGAYYEHYLRLLSTRSSCGHSEPAPQQPGEPAQHSGVRPRHCVVRHCFDARTAVRRNITKSRIFAPRRLLELCIPKHGSSVVVVLARTPPGSTTFGSGA